MKDMSNIDK